MNINIYKQKLVCKGKMSQKVLLSTMGTLLLGMNMCTKDFKKNFPENSIEKYADIQLLNGQSVPGSHESSSQKLSDHFLGKVRYLAQHRQLGFIQIENQLGEVEHKKIGVLFYAPKDLTDCSTIRLSQAGVTLVYLDGSIASLNTFIEVDGAFLDELSKEAQPLLDGNKAPLQATCSTDFTILRPADYGIKSFNDTQATSNRVVLLEDNVDKQKFKNIHHAGFILNASTHSLVEFVKHLSTDSVQSTSMIRPVSVLGNKLKLHTTSAEEADYCYIKNGNRYRLIPLKTCASSITGYWYGRTVFNPEMEKVAQAKTPTTEHQQVHQANHTTQDHSPIEQGLGIVDQELEWDDDPNCIKITDAQLDRPSVESNEYSQEEFQMYKKDTCLGIDQEFEWDDDPNCIKIAGTQAASNILDVGLYRPSVEGNEYSEEEFQKFFQGWDQFMNSYHPWYKKDKFKKLFDEKKSEELCNKNMRAYPFKPVEKSW